jgi:hypothetical protein
MQLLIPVIRRQVAWALLAAVALSAAFVAPVFGATTVTRFSAPYTFTEPLVDECTGVTGTLTGVGVFTGTDIETDKPWSFHEEAHNVADLTFSFVDGSYATGTVDEHLSFTTGTHRATVFTNAHFDTVDLYSSDGTLLYSVSFRLIEHTTFSSDDVVRAEFEIGHFRGGC